MNFGEYIRKYRNERNLTQQELAQMLGVSNTTISNYETGTSTPSFSCMLKLFSVLGTPFYGDENEEFSFCRQICEALSKTELKKHLKTLFALQADSTLCCPGILPNDFMFIGPFDSYPSTGDRIYYKSNTQSGIYKLYQHGNHYMLMPENPQPSAPLCVNSLENVYEIKALLHITARQ